MAYAPKGFNITGITDDRANKPMIGALNTEEQRTTFNLDAEVIKNFIAANVKQDKATPAINLHITKLDFDIKKNGPHWQVYADVSFTFYAGNNRLIEYSSTGMGKTDATPTGYIEGFIRHALEDDFKKLDGWWAQHKTQVTLSDNVKVNVVIGKTTDKPNYIVYSIARPLDIADFNGPVRGGIIEMASTSSGIGLTYSGETVNGQMAVNVVVTPYFNKAESWFKEEGKTPEILAHEQAHFDITAIKTCELAHTIQNTAFTIENYERLMDELRKKNFQEANEEENAYDNETDHGIITDKQQQWQTKLKEQVKAVGCY